MRLQWSYGARYYDREYEVFRTFAIHILRDLGVHEKARRLAERLQL